MLKGHNVYLRLLEKKDIRILYKLCNEEKVRKYNTIPNDIQSNNKKEKLRNKNETKNETKTKQNETKKNKK
jgi:diamine N-acetyltransferase